MKTSASTWQQFEDLVRRILQANNFDVDIHSPRGDKGFDFQAQLSGDIWAIEVKYYRTARAQPSLIEAAATRVVSNGVNANASKGMLAVSCFLSEELRHALEQKFSITFVDQVDLRNWCAAYPELTEELDALLEANPREPHAADPLRRSPASRSKPINYDSTQSPDTKGTELCRELEGIKKGKASWAQYEKTCEKVLKYLFPNDLHGWHSQKRTDDGLNRYDYVCRVRPTTEFWKFVIDHLNSRYILFEFKNYSGKIKQEIGRAHV